jgi:hypothetical protein
MAGSPVQEMIWTDPSAISLGTTMFSPCRANTSIAPIIQIDTLKKIGVENVFFAQGACATLVDGFHSGTSKAGSDQVETNIIYIELHYKPYQEHRRISKQKNRISCSKPHSKSNSKLCLNSKK